MLTHFPRLSLRYLIPGILLSGLLFLGFLVLREFLLTLSWALIIAYATWPPYRWLRRRLNNRAAFSAALMTIIIAALISLTVFGLANLLKNELQMAYQTLSAQATGEHHRLPDYISRIPRVGDFLQTIMDRFDNDQTGMAIQIADWSKQWIGQFANFLGGIGYDLMKLGVVIVTLFFCFRDGDKAVKQLHQGLVRYLGEYQHAYLQAAGSTTRAVVYGLVLAALGQGALAGFGYAVAGVKAPVLFAAVTALLAMIPMGATLVWIPLSFSLILMDRILPGIGLMLWGVVVVSTIDNVIRPLVISGAGKIPFLVVLFGVLGGVSAFGAIGLFLGPVILAVLLSVWQAWLKQQPHEDIIE
ncbi:MAG: AI-2E family transporter [Gammaproteobacteria bacterium]